MCHLVRPSAEKVTATTTVGTSGCNPDRTRVWFFTRYLRKYCCRISIEHLGRLTYVLDFYEFLCTFFCADFDFPCFFCAEGSCFSFCASIDQRPKAHDISLTAAATSAMLPEGFDFSPPPPEPVISEFGTYLSRDIRHFHRIRSQRVCVFFNFICFSKKKASPAFVLIEEERGWVGADDDDISFTTRVVSQCPDPFIYLLFHYDKSKNSRCVNTDGKYFQYIVMPDIDRWM